MSEDFKKEADLEEDEESDEEVCETCGGTGEVTTMEQVWAGEPNVAPIGSARCPDCNMPPEPEYDDQE